MKKYTKNKTKRLEIRLSEKELKAIQKYCKKNKLTKSELVIMALFEYIYGQ